MLREPVIINTPRSVVVEFERSITVILGCFNSLRNQLLRNKNYPRPLSFNKFILIQLTPSSFIKRPISTIMLIACQLPLRAFMVAEILENPKDYQRRFKSYLMSLPSSSSFVAFFSLSSHQAFRMGLKMGSQTTANNALYFLLAATIRIKIHQIIQQEMLPIESA